MKLNNEEVQNKLDCLEQRFDWSQVDNNPNERLEDFRLLKIELLAINTMNIELSSEIARLLNLINEAEKEAMEELRKEPAKIVKKTKRNNFEFER